MSEAVTQFKDSDVEFVNFEETSLDAVRELALAKLPSPRSTFLEHFSLFQFPPNITISEWADQNRVLVGQDSPIKGKWVTRDAPYEEEPMDVLGDPFVEETVLMWASQTGKTAGCILNTLGYYIDVDPSPIMIVYDTVGRAEDFSKQRLAPMIRECPALAAKIYKNTRGESSDSLLMKTYPGGMLKIGGAETPGSLAQFPIRVLLLDEIDRYPASTGKEGDPVTLARTRTSRFESRRKIILSSTPTVKGRSRIEFAYLGSSQARWQLKCPNPECDHWQTLLWHHIDYSSIPGKIVAGCDKCLQKYTKPKWLIQPGQWVHRFPENKVKGYHLNALVSPWTTWESLVKEWKEAMRAKESGNDYLLMVFINTKLAETWEDFSLKVSYHEIFEHNRKEYDEDYVPDGVFCITFGADIQDVHKRIHYEIVGWGKGYRSWGLDYGILYYDPHYDEWHDIFDKLVYNRLFKFANGRFIRARRGLMDSNGAIGPDIYRYTKPRSPRIYACKGHGQDRGTPGAFTSEYRVDSTYSTMWIPVNSTMCKDDLINKLLIVDADAQGYCNFPMIKDGEPSHGYTNEYFIGLTSEEKHEEVDKRGYGKLVYHKVGGSRTKNEPLDCRNYARAAMELAEQGRHIDEWEEPDYADPASLTNDSVKIFDPNRPGMNKRDANYHDFEDNSPLPRQPDPNIVVKERQNRGVMYEFGEIGGRGRVFNPYGGDM